MCGTIKGELAQEVFALRRSLQLLFPCALALLWLGCRSECPDTCPRSDVVATPVADEKPPPQAEPPVQEVSEPAQALPPATTHYKVPPAEVVEVVDAPATPAVIAAPEGRHIARVRYESLPGIDVLATKFYPLAGLRIDPARSARRVVWPYTGIVLQRVYDGEEIPVDLPADAVIGYPRWSPDGSQIAFTRTIEAGVELWIADVETGAARRVLDRKIGTVMGSGFTWMPGSKSLLVQLIPEVRGPEPAAPAIPDGPHIQDTAGRAAQNRTYQDLLKNRHDGQLFAYHATTQLALIKLEDGTATAVGKPGIFYRAQPSPDGKHILVTTLHEPFSYVVPYYRFPRTHAVWTIDGELKRTIAKLPAAEEVPIQGVPTGPRSLQWQPFHPATVVWAEALDDGDPRNEVEYRDRLMRQSFSAPGEASEVMKVAQRHVDTSFTSNRNQVLVTEYDRDRRWITTRLHDLATPGPGQVLFDRSVHDSYGDPGEPVTEVLADGSQVVKVEDGWIYLAGDGATPKGDRPFLDRRKLSDGTTEHLMQSPADAHVQFVAFAANEAGRGYLLRRESPSEPPNYFFREKDGNETPLTRFPHPYPQLAGVQKRLLTYKRADGTPLSGTLYLPPNYKEGDKLPLLVWAYPLEYNDADTAGQVRSAPNRFSYLRGTSPLLFLTQGYAVLDDAAMPVVGDPETVNDTFVEQIVSSAQAAIDAVVAEGVADPDRVGVAGHSYGAFMTANLLAHCDLFRAGIARSGAYNRTLTPFGFQGERRTLWEARETYIGLSPLFFAHTINEPLLMFHGEVDNNSGTFPMQSRRLFHALQGLGGHARLVMLPHESHGYRARESVLHVLAESIAWFDEHVKPPKPAADAEQPPQESPG